MDKIIVKILWFLKPFVTWFDHTFTAPWTVKKIDFDEYYTNKHKIKKGTVFVTDTYGQGSNILNPSKGKHGAIYFGKGLKTHISNLLEEMAKQPDADPRIMNRIRFVMMNKKIKDEIPYVIEAVGEGVSVKSLGKFFTTKDKLKAYNPKFATDDQMNQIANNCVLDLGLGYDYGFEDDDNYKYCFEVVVDGYKSVFPNLQLKEEEVWGHKFYLASAFYDEKLWSLIIYL